MYQQECLDSLLFACCMAYLPLPVAPDISGNTSHVCTHAALLQYAEAAKPGFKVLNTLACLPGSLARDAVLNLIWFAVGLASFAQPNCRIAATSIQSC